MGDKSNEYNSFFAETYTIFKKITSYAVLLERISEGETTVVQNELRGVLFHLYSLLDEVETTKSQNYIEAKEHLFRAYFDIFGIICSLYINRIQSYSEDSTVSRVAKIYPKYFSEILPTLKTIYEQILLARITRHNGNVPLESLNANEKIIITLLEWDEELNNLKVSTLKSKKRDKISVSPSDKYLSVKSKMRAKSKSIFISYCHSDEEWLKKLNVVLQTMDYEGLEFSRWDDTHINAGDLWKKEIEMALERADIAILLVSNEFLASEFIREKEVPPLLKKAQENGTKILPIILGWCRFTKSVISDYQAVNKPEKPMNSLSQHEQEKVFYELTLAMDNILKE